MEKFRWNPSDRNWYGPEKDPSDIVDYVVNFAKLVGTDPIISHYVSVTGATMDSSVLAGSKVTVWLSAGTPSSVIDVDVTIVTSGGRRFSRKFKVPVRDL